MAVLDKSGVELFWARSWLVIFCKDLLHEIVEESEVPHEEHELPRIGLSRNQFKSVVQKVVIQLSDKVDGRLRRLHIEFKLGHK